MRIYAYKYGEKCSRLRNAKYSTSQDPEPTRNDQVISKYLKFDAARVMVLNNIFSCTGARVGRSFKRRDSILEGQASDNTFK